MGRKIATLQYTALVGCLDREGTRGHRATVRKWPKPSRVTAKLFRPQVLCPFLFWRCWRASWATYKIRRKLILFAEIWMACVAVVLAGVTLHSIPGITLVCYQSFPGFDCRFIALKSRNVAHEPRTKFLLKFVPDISTKMTLSSFRVSVSVRDLHASEVIGVRDLSAVNWPSSSKSGI